MSTLNKLGKATLERVAKSLKAQVVHEPKVNSLNLWENYPENGKIFLYDWQFGISDCGNFNNCYKEGGPFLFHAINSLLATRNESTDFDYRHLMPRFSHVGIYDSVTSTFRIHRLTNGYEKVKAEIDCINNPENFDFEDNSEEFTIDDAMYLICHPNRTRMGYRLKP